LRFLRRRQKSAVKNLAAAEFCFSSGFSTSRIFFGGFSAGPNFSAAAAKFGG